MQASEAMGRVRAEAGQTAAELLGILLLVAIIIGAIATSPVPSAVACGTRGAIDAIAGADVGCSESGAPGATRDADRDGVSDADERARGTDPRRADSDGDGVSDGDEADAGTDPLHEDSDGDGLPDGDEAAAGRPAARGLRRRRPAGRRRGRRRTDPRNADTDRDGLSDLEEAELGTDPRNADSDGDGVSDGQELEQDSDPFAADTDGDGENDAEDDDPLKYTGDGGDAVKGAVCGDSSVLFCPDADDPSRATTEYILGQILSGLLAVGDIRDGVDALFNGRWGDAFWSAVGFVPAVGDATKIGEEVLSVIRKFPGRKAEALALIYKLFPDGGLRRAALDAATDGGASALRNSGLTDDVIEQLAKKGNDLRKLADNARLGSRTLDPGEAAALEAEVARRWPPECAPRGSASRPRSPSCARTRTSRSFTPAGPGRANRSTGRHRRGRPQHRPHDHRRGQEHRRRRSRSAVLACGRQRAASA